MLPLSESWREPHLFFQVYCSESVNYRDSVIKFVRSLIPREESAIRDLKRAMKDTEVGGRSEGAHLHIVHLSDAQTTLELLKVRRQHTSLTFTPRFS
jgi:hypothetical protein